MQKENVARIYYEYYAHQKNQVISCTCGYYGVIDYRNFNNLCPKCGTNHIKEDKIFISKFRGKDKHTFNIVNIDFTNKSFYIKKKNIKTCLNWNEEKQLSTLDLISEDVFETWFNAEKPNSTKILKNGKELSLTKAHLEHALSNIDITYFYKNKNSIFYSYYYELKTEATLSHIVWDLINYPQYEIFYNTYGTLKPLRNLQKKYLNKGNSPSEILNIPKTVWTNLYNLNEDNDLDGKIYFHWTDILNFVNKYKNKLDVVNKVLTTAIHIDINNIEKMFELFELNYDMDRLYEYLTEDIYTYQGIEDKKQGFQLLYDYIHMSRLMNVSFEKYPKSLKLRHDLALKNLKIVVTDTEKREMELILSKSEYKDLEYKDTKYTVIRPSSAQDIIEEGKSLHHCVGSYVDLVRKNKTMILFMRYTDKLNKSLITLEVRGGILRQYAGSCDRSPTEEEMQFIKKYCKEKNIEINDKHMMYYIE